MKRRVSRLIAVMLAAVIVITPALSVDVFADEAAEEVLDADTENAEAVSEDKASAEEDEASAEEDASEDVVVSSGEDVGDEEPPVDEYDYQIKVKIDGDDGSGTVCINGEDITDLYEEDGYYLSGANEGDEITLSAEEAEGYRFLFWEDDLGNILSLDREIAFEADDDMAVVASFQNVEYVTYSGGLVVADDGEFKDLSAPYTLDPDYDSLLVTYTGHGSGFLFFKASDMTITGKGKDAFNIDWNGKEFDYVTSKSTLSLKASVKNDLAPGTYKATVTLKERDGVIDPVSFTLKVKIEGETIEDNFDISTAISPAGAGTATGGGTYSSTDKVTLKAKANKHYTFVGWYLGSELKSNKATYTFTPEEDGKYTAKFKVDKSDPISIKNAKVTGLKSMPYTGKAITQKPVVKLGSTTLKSGTDYTVSYKNNKAIGTAMVTITGKGGYTGTAKGSFKIVKGNNPIRVTARKVRVNYYTLRKKNVTIQPKKAMAISGAQGALSYKKVGRCSVANISSKGVITVLKGAPGGPVKLKVRVTAKGNSNYKSGYKDVDLNIWVGN